MITLPKNDFSIIVVLFLCSLELLFFSTKKEFRRKEPYEYNIGILISQIVLFFVLHAIGLLRDSSNITLYIFSYFSIFKVILQYFISIEFGILLLQIMYNKNIYEKINFIDNIKFYWKKSLKRTISFIIIFTFLIFLIIMPQIDRPENIQEKDCTITKTYYLSSNYNIFGVYKRSIFVKDITEIEFIFKGIPKRDGEYVVLNLLNKSLDKKYLQYFDIDVIGDKKLNYRLFMFRDKNIAHIDSIEIKTITKVC
jgi:hypothetical protein